MDLPNEASSPMDDAFTQILEDCRDGAPDALERMFTCVYRVLHGLASEQMNGQSPRHTWQPTALVHEAYLRLGGGNLEWNDRAHFLAAAATAMRQALVDHARERARVKRGENRTQLPLDAVDQAYASRSVDLLELNEALCRLEETDPRMVKLVELRFFGGCSNEEVAKVLGVTARTVERDWVFARHWLFRELSIS